MQLIPVILCGGSGTRLWPASRQDMPKQFLTLMNDQSLLQNTAQRILRLPGVDAAKVVTVSLAELMPETSRHLETVSPALTSHLIAEPTGRNTAAAMALAARYVQARFGDDAVMLIMPSDHHIADETALANAVEKAASAAEMGHITLLGIRPTRPETGYGYIAPGEILPQDGVHQVQRFVEKPDAEKAREYIGAGYLWNSGIYIARADTLLKSIAQQAQDISDLIGHALSDTDNLCAPSPHFYDAIRRESFEKAVLEKMDNVAVAECDIAWSDIGSWASLWETGTRDENGNMCISSGSGSIVARGAENCLIHAHKRIVACIGVRDIVIVETNDAILIADKNSGDSLRAIVADLQERGASAAEPEEIPVLRPVRAA